MPRVGEKDLNLLAKQGIFSKSVHYPGINTNDRDSAQNETKPALALVANLHGTRDTETTYSTSHTRSDGSSVEIRITSSDLEDQNILHLQKKVSGAIILDKCNKGTLSGQNLQEIVNDLEKMGAIPPNSSKEKITEECKKLNNGAADYIAGLVENCLKSSQISRLENLPLAIDNLKNQEDLSYGRGLESLTKVLVLANNQNPDAEVKFPDKRATKVKDLIEYDDGSWRLTGKGLLLSVENGDKVAKLIEKALSK